MKKFKYLKSPRMSSFFSSFTRHILAVMVLIFALDMKAQQDSLEMPSWWFGASAAANFNFYDGSTQVLNAGKTTPAVFHNGNGIGFYAGPLVEFYRPESLFGLMLQAGYDNRKGSFDSQLSPCNCPADLSTKLSYIVFEPSLRFAPFRNDFFLYLGPRFAYNLDKSFKYQQRANPAYPEQADGPEITGDFSDMKQVLVSMQVGAGYDIHLSRPTKATQFILAPFVAFHPYFGQAPRTSESWQVTTVRAGLALKMGRARKPDSNEPKAAVVAPVEAEILFTLHAPENLPVERRVRETFPLRNYVFFDEGSTTISERYVLLRKDEVKDFKEGQLEVFKPKNLSGRNARQLVAYYNILNIVGDRMGKNPDASINLVGSSEQGPDNGKAMSESVKKYLVDVFGIKASRISTEGRTRPELPSGTEGIQNDQALLSQGNRRVSIESTSPAMLMEFQSGSDAPLKPVEIVDLQQAPVDSYLAIEADGGSDPFTSWSLQTIDKNGAAKNFGPFTEKTAAIPGKDVLGTNPDGYYKVILTGTTKSGKTVTRESDVYMKLWTPATDEEGMRYSVIFEYNTSQSPQIYEKYLTEIVRPKITEGAKVIIHGHTDAIGNPTSNQKLSEARAKDVHRILQQGVNKAGTRNVKFEVLGFGENDQLSPFENKYPEERSYNRTVIIDIIPRK